MLYSVWRPDARKYDYYETPHNTADDPQATHLRATSALGADDVGGAWPVPVAARKIGSGALAKGMVGSFEGGGGVLGGLTDGIGLGTLILGGVAAYGAWKLWGKK